MNKEGATPWLARTVFADIIPEPNMPPELQRNPSYWPGLLLVMYPQMMVPSSLTAHGSQRLNPGSGVRVCMGDQPVVEWVQYTPPTVNIDAATTAPSPEVA